MRAFLIAIFVAGACAPPPLGGSLDMLVYNVAGLPDGLNEDQNPVVNIPQISPKLNAYDLVLVQEDFAYTFELRESLDFAFESFPKEDIERFMNDGLNRFSTFAFEPELEREMWELCSGFLENSNDCLAEKGFSFAELAVDEEVSLHVYNLHMDAGGGDEDNAAREAQIEQLLSFVDEHSADQPVVIAGDTNLSFDFGEDDPDEERLQRLIEEGGLTDACEALDCPDLDRIDRVFIRDGGGVRLSFSSWTIDESMVDDQGQPLSDHDAVAVGLDWAK